MWQKLGQHGQSTLGHSESRTVNASNGVNTRTVNIVNIQDLDGRGNGSKVGGIIEWIYELSIVDNVSRTGGRYWSLYSRNHYDNQ